jgi:4-alpha-glucanotransferase
LPSRRASGILLHPTSLPGRFGIGELGPEALRFIDFLSASSQRLWQVLPLGPTGYGDSPYQCFSAFAGNPLLVSLDTLASEGLLSADDLDGGPRFSDTEIDYGAVIGFKLPLLEKAYRTFEAGANVRQREAFEAFRREQAGWLEEYALFTVVKEAHGGGSWTDWEEDIRARRPAAMARWRKGHAEAIRAREFAQYLFFMQWREVKEACHARGIRVMGDIPIFVAHDSADVWAHPELFQLHADGRPAFVAGVPPDYFSATGQLWGNPLYRWDRMEALAFQWWIERFRATLATVDLVRLDHFRGFEAFWKVPGDAKTAEHGEWVKGPGAGLFEALRHALGELPIVAENLGVITPEVEALRHRFGFPGMSILQFAFGSDPQGSTFIPHNFVRELAAYTGTHDNDTTVGWWTSGVGDTTRSAPDVEAERAYALDYLKSDGREIHWDFIRALIASVADLTIVPLQDVLGLGSEARMNLPGRPGGNWRWRYAPGALTPEITERLRKLTDIYGRAQG